MWNINSGRVMMGYSCPMRLKQHVLWLMLVMACPPSLAQHSQVFETRFYGYVQYVPPPPCTPDVFASGHIVVGSVVDLPSVNYTEMPNPDDTKGDTLVTFRANGCTGFNINHMWVYFTTGAGTDIEGRVIPNGSSDLRFELRDEDSGNLIRVGQGGSNSSPDVATQGTSEPFSGTHLSSAWRVAEKVYRIRYYTPTGLTQSSTGNFSAPMTAHFRYY